MKTILKETRLKNFNNFKRLVKQIKQYFFATSGEFFQKEKILQMNKVKQLS